MSTRWTQGNHIELLENGEAFFPRVFEAIDQAHKEVMLETFIVFNDSVGRQLHDCLLRAAQRGVRVSVLVDGYGSSELGPDFTGALQQAGVRLRVFDPGSKWFGLRTNVLRRMHRKLVVVDATVAFIGGINYSEDHLMSYGPLAKQDYAVVVRGPIVATIDDFVRQAGAADDPKPAGRWARWRRRKQAALTQSPQTPVASAAQTMFVTRDNHRHRDDIEQHYRIAIRLARHSVTIANAYFFPGYRFLRELRRAARRGVKVSLVLQGNPDMPIAQSAARLLYYPLLKAGVQIHEYTRRPLHGKVAVIDDIWATVGSSNLDPLSLSLNLEANLFLRDEPFAGALSRHLQELIAQDCQPMVIEDVRKTGLWTNLRSFLLYHLLRHYPDWAGLLPSHEPVYARLPGRPPHDP